MSLSSLKKGSSLDKLKKAVEASSAGNTGGKNVDDRFWQPEVDAAGNGYAVVRFLDTPAVDGEDGLPWVQIWSHGFQGPGGWYIENSLTTLGKTDPVSEHNTVLWNSGIEANKEIARKQKRKLTYIANILVISDAKRPQNEGKVFLFKFGKKIFDKIKEQLEPQFADETPMNPFDFWKGANFKIKIRNVEGYRNYDKSEFADVSALLDGNDEKLEELWKKQFSLKDFTERKNFKPYDQLKGRLDKVLGFTGAPIAKSKAEDTVASFKDDVSVLDSKISESDDDLDYFKSLADQD